MDGISAAVKINDVDSFDFNSFTISAWIRTTDAGSGYRGIILKHYAYGLFLHNNQLATYNWAGGGIYSSGIPLNDGQWHHVAMTKASSHAPAALYIDGQLVATVPYNIANHDHNLVIGAGNAAGNQQNFRGDIARVKITDYALSTASMKKLFTEPDTLLSELTSFDPHGNLLNKGDITFTYNDANRLATSTRGDITTEYFYNANSQRVKKQTEGKPRIMSTTSRKERILEEIAKQIEITGMGTTTKTFSDGGIDEENESLVEEI